MIHIKEWNKLIDSIDVEGNYPISDMYIQCQGCKTFMEDLHNWHDDSTDYEEILSQILAEYFGLI